jgi:hypothetical protein
LAVRLLEERTKPETDFEFRLFTEFSKGEKHSYLQGYEVGYIYGLKDAEKLEATIQRYRFTQGKPSKFDGGRRGAK